MNRYRLGLSLFVLTGAALAFLYEQPHSHLLLSPPKTTAVMTTGKVPTDPAINHALSKTAGHKPASITDTQTTFVLPPLPHNNIPPLETLLNDLANLFGELNNISAMLANSQAPDQAPDEATLQLYQPQIERLQQRYIELQQQALTLSRDETQRFLWDQLVNYHFPMDNSHLILNALNDPADSLLEDMFSTLTNPSYNVTIRQMLAYNLLRPNSYHYLNVQPSRAESTEGAETNTPTTRQLRLKAFLEEQIQSESQPPLLGTYMDIYRAMANETHLVSAEQFTQQLEMARSHLLPEQYFSFRLQELSLTQADADYANLLNDISHTHMEPQQYRSLLLRLADEINSKLTPAQEAVDKSMAIPDPTRQVLLQFLHKNLPQPDLRDSFSLYQYGTQMYSIQLLENPQQGAEQLYQKIVSSSSLAEQVSMLSALPLSDGSLQKKLREQTNLKQRLESALLQAGTQGDMRVSLEAALSNLMMEPPTITTESLSTTETPDNANTTDSVYSVETFNANGLPHQAQTKLDSDAPAAQSARY